MFSVHIDGENLELLPLLPGEGAQVKPLLEGRGRAGGELWDGPGLRSAGRTAACHQGALEPRAPLFRSASFDFPTWSALFLRYLSLITPEYRDHLLGHLWALPKHKNSVLWTFKLRPRYSCVSGPEGASVHCFRL